ncbi:MAG: manganese efflux pump [Clostridia bacterium]|nr:manganese efflux pump [Clostridia bacterium]
MEAWEIIITAVSLAMDAFAVALCKGAAAGRVKIKDMLTVGVWFGGAQALMPLIGFLLGSAFLSLISSFDHWIAFALLGFIGVNMLVESFGKDEESHCGSFAFGIMLTMAVATSIDALAVGITLAVLPGVNIPLAIGAIGVITFILSALGVKLGGEFGARYKKWAERVGGIVLVGMGIKILLEHLIAG